MMASTASATKPPIRKSAKYLAGMLVLLSPLLGLALEIGTPTSVPVLSQPLRLEIPLGIIPAGATAPQSDCVRLTPRSDDSENNFFPGDMRAVIEARQGGAATLVITSAKAISNPVVGFRVRIGCEAGVSRDFILLASPREIVAPVKPQPIQQVAQSAPSTQSAQPSVTSGTTQATSSIAETAQSPAGQGNEMVVSRNTTLNKLARARYPSSLETRDEYRRLMALANPNLFAGADQVGSVPIPAGTVLKIPSGLPKTEAKVRKEARAKAVAELPQAVGSAKAEAAGKATEAQLPRTSMPAETVLKSPGKKSDRLVIGGGHKEGRASALSQQELAQSLGHLEQMMSEKSRSDVEMSETLKSLANSFGEVKNYLQGVDERVKRAEVEQVRAQAELQQLRLRLRKSFGLIELLAAVIGGGAVGAALMIAFQRLSMRRRPVAWDEPKSFDTPSATGGVVEGDQSVTSGAPPKSVAPVPQKETQAAPANIRGTRLEPTVKNTVERTAGPASKAGPVSKTGPASKVAPAAIPSAIKNAPVGEVAGAKPNPPKSVETAQAKAVDFPMEFSRPDAKVETKLPKATAQQSAPVQTAKGLVPTAPLAPLAPLSSDLRLELPASATTEVDLELSLEGSQTPLTAAEAGPSSVDPVLELADVMTSLGLAKEAASAVVDHIRQNKHQDPLHWFKVLEIYRKTGHREGFDEAVQELRQKLNVSINDWDADTSSAENTTLENYPHLIRELVSLWGKPEGDAFLTDLLEDNRGGKRVGFPQAVAEEIVLLRAILRNVPQIDFPPINVPAAGEDNKQDSSESKAWREMRLIP